MLQVGCYPRRHFQKFSIECQAGTTEPVERAAIHLTWVETRLRPGRSNAGIFADRATS